MNTVVLLKHIDRIYESINSIKPIVFVLKGFPIDFLKDLNLETPHVDKLSCINKDNRIDLNKVENNIWDIGSKLQKTKKGQKHFILFEELLVIPPHSLPKLDFYIIKNNFYDFYPNQSTCSFPDIERSLDNEKTLEEDVLFQKFYSNSKTIANIECIQYLDYDDDNIKILSLFNPDEYNLPHFSADYSNVEGLIQFLAPDSSYDRLKYAIYFNKIPSKVNLLIDEKYQHIDSDFNELKILVHLLEGESCELHLYLKPKQIENKWRPELDELLKRHWGEEATFNKLNIYKDPDVSKELLECSQGSIVEHIIKQCELARQNILFEDIFLTASTGAGKSLLFQLSAIYLSEIENYKPVTIIISPLKSLMADQVIALKNNRKFGGVAFLNSDLSLIERNQILEQIYVGEISLLYLSPELLLSYDIKNFIGERELGLLIIDEAHLVTTWGRDFRVDYWFLGNYIRKLRRGTTLRGRDKNKLKTYRFPVVAVTATAVYNGEDDMVFETISSLNMQNCQIYIGRVKRNEISFKYYKLIAHAHDLDKENKTKERIREFALNGNKSIFYFPWISQIETLYPTIDKEILPKVRKYHASLDSEYRGETLNEFKNGETKIVLATKAFGMGVDISDIEIVYHHAPSGALSDYVQEIGRVARKPGMSGTAIMDFNIKDLKYTKILFGLSSLKQYQVRLVLMKINNLYKIKKNRNMLVSVEDFQYIFANDNNIEQKVKSALLVLEKDLLAKYNYNVIIVRPKSLFSTVFASIKNELYDDLIRDYGEFIIPVEKNQIVHEKKHIDKNTVLIQKDNNCKRVKIQLDKLWENRFPEESFPSIKHKFFNKELIPNIIPSLRLSIYFNDELGKISSMFDKQIKVLERSLFSHNFVGKYFTKDDLIKELKAHFNNASTCKKLADLLTVFYSDNNQFGNGKKFSEGNFLQEKRDGYDYKYKIIDFAFIKVRSNMRMQYDKLFSGLKDDTTEYQGFIAVDKNNPISKGRIKLAYLLEILDLATYELKGGELPQLFVRINDPQKINSLCKNDYSNNVVTDVERRHKLAMEIMSYFFNSDMTDEERWDYIEDYFLGREITLAN